MYHNYCSIYSEEYLYKGLLLYKSLEKHDKDFRLFLIFLSDNGKQIFESLDLRNAVCLSISDIEEYDADMLTAKETRNIKEYIWTAKASVMLYLLKHYEDLDHIIWLDGDTFFFSSPDPIYDEWGEDSILLTDEGFNGPYEYLSRKHGVYNTGLMGFKRDSESTKCLDYFRDKLLEWCYDRFEPGLWSDQMHVCDWPERFNNVRVIKNPGINLTPFKLFRINVEEKGIVRSIGEDIFINDTKLVFYHYYGFGYFDDEQFDLCSYDMTFSDQAIRAIYYPYIDASIAAVRSIRDNSRNYYTGMQIKDKSISNYFNLKVNSRLNNSIISFCTIVKEDTLKQGLALYYSIKENSKNFQMWFCCLDDESFKSIGRLGLEDITAIHFINIAPDELKNLHSKYSGKDFEKLIKPWFLLHVTKNHVNIENIVFIDSHCCLLSDPSIVFCTNTRSPAYLLKNMQLNHKVKKRKSYSSSVILFCRSKVYFDCLYWWKKKYLERGDDIVGVGAEIESLYINMWTRIFDGITSVDGYATCESRRDLGYIRYNLKDQSFYLMLNKVIAVKPYVATIKSKELKEYVNSLIKTAERVLGE